jgi:hypothetical protein
MVLTVVRLKANMTLYGCRQKESEMAVGMMKPERNLTDDLERIQEGWKLYEYADPDPVYLYLARVYKVVTGWPQEHRAKYARQLLILAKKKAPANSEPFAAVILCTSKADLVDNKLRNDWSRALQFADEHNVNSKGLRDFIQNHGGLKKCARELSK